MSGTSPKDQSALLWNAKPAAPTSHPGERLWTLRRDGGWFDAELRDHGRHGTELQLFQNGEFLSGRRYASRALALEEAHGCRQRLETEGWRDE